MGQFFPDFASTARLGFQSGMEMGQGQNPLGQFIRMMLADYQSRRAAAGEYEMKRGLIQEEYGLRSQLQKEELAAEAENQGKTIQQIIGQGNSSGGGWRGTKVNIGGMTFENPEAQLVQKQQEEDVRPLAGDTAARYSGAVQGLKNIEEIRKDLATVINDEKSAKELVRKANYAVEATAAKPTFIPGLEAGYRRYKEKAAGDIGANLGNKFLTLAENLLRARSGAAVPEPETVREKARTLLNQFYESPKTWENKLKNNELFLTGIADEVRPLRKGKHIANSQKTTLSFSSKAEVEAANLPKGTEITINGRPAIWE